MFQKPTSQQPDLGTGLMKEEMAQGLTEAEATETAPFSIYRLIS